MQKVRRCYKGTSQGLQRVCLPLFAGTPEVSDALSSYVLVATIRLCRIESTIHNILVSDGSKGTMYMCRNHTCTPCDPWLMDGRFVVFELWINDALKLVGGGEVRGVLVENKKLLKRTKRAWFCCASMVDLVVG